ncbi:MAG: hypothetical protein ACYDDZ_06700 [Acidimicrobiales bacterium]
MTSDERTPAEERTVILHTQRDEEFYEEDGRCKPMMFSWISTCAWCGAPVKRHSLQALELCDRAYEQELARRRAGPPTIGAVATVRRKA